MVVAGLILLLVVLQPMWRPSPDGQGLGSRLDDAPAGIARALSTVVAANPAARVFNAQRWGSWLELDVPAARLFADSRIELIPAPAWIDYLQVTAGDASWRGILDRWRVDVLVVSATDQPTLATLVGGDPGWRSVYRDSDGLVAVRVAP